MSTSYIATITYRFELSTPSGPVTWEERADEVWFDEVEGLSNSELLERLNAGIPDAFVARISYTSDGIDGIDLYGGEMRAVRYQNVWEWEAWHAEAYRALAATRPTEAPCRVTALGPVVRRPTIR